jgi:hypothetical protein
MVMMAQKEKHLMVVVYYTIYGYIISWVSIYLLMYGSGSAFHQGHEPV